MSRKVFTGVLLALVLTTFRALATDLALPSANEVTNQLGKLSWARNFQQIPATVIDKGVLQNVPYSSFKSEDYEINVYGDPNRPACIEVGRYKTLLNDYIAMKNCINFIADILPTEKLRGALREMKMYKDIKTVDGLTLEITPPTDEDAYGGWWVSVYSSEALEAAKATGKELSEISVPKNSVALSNSTTNPSGWSRSDISLSRPSVIYAEISVPTLTISGQEYKDVHIIRRNAAEVTVKHSIGVATYPMEELSPDFRQRLGYNATEARAFTRAAFLATQVAVVSQMSQPAPAYQPLPAYQPTPSPQPDQPPVAESTQPQSYTGAVYIRGYYRSNGTYVSPHTRGR